MSIITNCIFCGRDLFSPEDISSVEHIIPDSLGGRVTIDCVCKQCNNSLGQNVDSKLCNSTFVKNVKRFMIQDEQEKYREIVRHNSFEDGDQKTIPIIMNKKKNKEMPEFYTGNPPDIELLKDDNNRVVDIIVRDGMDKASVRKAIERQAKAEGAELNSEWLDDFMEKRAHIIIEPIEVRAAQRLNNGFQECIIKMTYEFGRILLGSEYESDCFGKQYRSFLNERIKGNTASVICPVIEDTVSNPSQWIDTIKAVFFDGEEDQLWIRIILYDAVVFENIVTNERSKYRISSNCYTDLSMAVTDWKCSVS